MIGTFTEWTYEHFASKTNTQPDLSEKGPILLRILASFSVINNSRQLVKPASWRHLPLRNFYMIDYFFCLSGLMTSYILLGKLKQSKGQMSYTSILTLRWIRLAVPMIGMFCIIYLVPLVGDGPLWEDGVNMLIQPCYNYWHRNLLFVNNIYFDMPPLSEYMVCLLIF
jgi:hypothetical protein